MRAVERQLRSGAARQVYYQRNGWLGVLSRIDAGWQLLPLAENYAGEAPGAAVVITDYPEKLGESWWAAIRDDRVRLLYAIDSDGHLSQMPAGPIFAAVQLGAPAQVLRSQIAAAFENIELLQHQRQIEQQIGRARSEIDRLNEIGIALSSEHDRGSLLNLILRISREITQSDAGS